MVDYTIKEVEPCIYAVVIKDKYDRAMTFCRVQEYYESANHRFRGNPFSMWEYMAWYASKHGGSFTYPADWSGFNLPFRTIVECLHAHHMSYKESDDHFETPYDRAIHSIVWDILSKSGYKSLAHGYVIATESTKGDTFKHEICHARYYADKCYKERADQAIEAVYEKFPKLYKQLKANLGKMGYGRNVIEDEIHAYLQYGYANPKFSHGVHQDEMKAIRNVFLDAIKQPLRP